jgi:hypothetical protein
MPMPKCFRHLNRVLCLILTLFMIGIEYDICFGAYSCWRKMLIEDCFCSSPWRMCTSSKSELSEREQTKKIFVVKASVSKEIFQRK